MPRLNHRNASESVGEQVSRIVSLAEGITSTIVGEGKTWLIEGKETYLSVEVLSTTIARKTELNPVLCRAIVSTWLAQHADLELEPGKGICLRGHKPGHDLVDTREKRRAKQMRADARRIAKQNALWDTLGY